jgi:subtilisin family serine protease
MSIPLRLLSLLAVTALLPAQRRVVPDDPLFRDQYFALERGGTARPLVASFRDERRDVALAAGVELDLPLAWSITTGSRSVVVAFLDDGFFWWHEDLARNVWRNPGETGTDARGLDRAQNGVDDDGNGYVDDVIGWDFAFDDPDPDPYVFDGMDRTRIQPYWHSVSALGIVGACGHNGIGVAGINWDVSMMLLKIGAQGEPRDGPGLERVERAARAIRYAADNGARVINWSGYVRPKDPAVLAPLRDAIRYAASREVLIVAGAGNDARDLDDPANAMFPQCFDEPNLVRVAQVALDGTIYVYETGGQRRGSNFGARTVEIAAVGEHFTTDVRNGRSAYATSNGTSSAGPVVAGVAALVLAARPGLSAAELKQALVESAVPLPGLVGKVRSSGVVNAYRALVRATRR